MQCNLCSCRSARRIPTVIAFAIPSTRPYDFHSTCCMEQRHEPKAIMLMAGKKDKDVVVSFRVDSHLANVLNSIPDKSSFIRDIILRSFYETCPVCRGRGVVPEELSNWATGQLKEEKAVECHCCLYAYPRSSLPAGSVAKRARAPFTCPHCQTHGHAH